MSRRKDHQDKALSRLLILCPDPEPQPKPWDETELPTGQIYLDDFLA